MTQTEHKLSVASAIAEKLNAARLTWAVGASLMLYLRNLVDEFHDIDIMVAESDAAAAAAILSQMGSSTDTGNQQGFKTRCFCKYAVQGVEVDLISGFVIVNGGTAHECPLEAADIDGEAEITGQTLPLHSLRCWRRYYELMGRSEKAALVDRALSDN